MSHYDLERLSSEGFQDLAAALVKAEFGQVVRKLGRGPDGGRDMDCHGSLIWAKSGGETGVHWDGYTVFQVKQKATPLRDKRDATWLWGQIKDELESWADVDGKRGRVPDNLVFITNVRLSPKKGDGGLDTIGSNIANWFIELHARPSDGGPHASSHRARSERMKRIKNWKLVDGNDLDGWLDVHAAVRRAFCAFLTVGDVLDDLRQSSGVMLAADLDSALIEHARSSLMRERMVYFEEAGGDGAGVPVERIAIDLPLRVHGSDERARALAFCAARAEHILKPSFATVTRPRHVVITGTPGNGKTTVSKFLVQAYRAALLDGSSLGDEHTSALEETSDRFESLCGRRIRHRRWPFRVDLARFAGHYQAPRARSLLGWIAGELTGDMGSAALRATELKKWLANWPALLVLDGLDEVTEPAVRHWVIGCIDELAAEAETGDWDLLLIATTRPIGYADEMSASSFERLDLDLLTREEALEYGRLVTSLRLGADIDRAERVDRLLTDASCNESLSHLLRTPLQVQILTVIAETASAIDPDRYSLFWRYYQTVVEREQRKSTGLSELLRDHSAQVLDLHERMGLELQCRSEQAAGATAALPEPDLRELAWQVLASEGYRPGDRDSRLLDRIVAATTYRLVLIAPREGGYGFDVRSLQELMAARRLGTGSLERRLANLRAIAPSPHWRNTWLFAAGRILVEPHTNEHNALIELIADIDQTARDRLSSMFPVGPFLAWELIDDGIAETRPKRLEALARIGLGLLRYPAPQRVDDFTGILIRVAERSQIMREMSREALRDALSGDASSRSNAERVQEQIAEGTTPRGGDDVFGLATVKKRPGTNQSLSDRTDWQLFKESLVQLARPEREDVTATLADALQTLAAEGPRSKMMKTVFEAMADPDVAEAIEVAADYLGRNELTVIETLRLGVEVVVARRPVAHYLVPAEEDA